MEQIGGNANPLSFQVEHLVLGEYIQNCGSILQKGRVLAWHVCLLLLPSLFALPLPPVDQIHQASNRGRLQRCVKCRRIILSYCALIVFIFSLIVHWLIVFITENLSRRAPIADGWYLGSTWAPVLAPLARLEHFGQNLRSTWVSFFEAYLCATSSILEDNWATK